MASLWLCLVLAPSALAQTSNVTITTLSVSNQTVTVHWNGGDLYRPYQLQKRPRLSEDWLNVDTPFFGSHLTSARAENAAIYRVSQGGLDLSLFDQDPPTVPGGLTIYAASCNQIVIYWNSSADDPGGSGVRAYYIYRNGAFLKQAPSWATSTFDSGTLTPLTSYTYTILAIDGAGNASAATLPMMATTPACTDPTAPSTPKGLAATVVTTTRIDLTWNLSTDSSGSGILGYRVYRNGRFLRQISAPLRSASDNGLAPGTTYSYAVSAVNNLLNESAQSEPVNATLPLPERSPPTIPTGLTTTPVSCSQIDLAWNASTDAGGSGLKGYEVYRNGIYLKEVLAPATSTSDNGLNSSTTYSYSVLAFDNDGNRSARSSDSSAATPACPDTTPPSTPTGLIASAPNCSQINLWWNASTDNTGGSALKGYLVYRNGAFLKQVLAPATSTADSGLSAVTSYSYTVSAVDNQNNASAQSSAVNPKTPACACNYETSPAGASVSHAGGSGTITVMAPNGCGWVTAANAGWITIDSGSSGAGEGSVAWSVATNDAPSRTGLIIIGGQTFTITQAAAPCSFSLSQPGASVPSSSFIGSVNVTAGSGCSWTATSTVSWISSDSTGSGNGTAFYTVAANTSSSPRIGTLTIAGQLFTVTQSGGAATCSYALSSASASPGPAAASGTMTVTAGVGCSWTASSSAPSWLTCSPAVGSGSGTVTWFVTSNTSSSPRTGTLTIAGQIFTVTQAGSAATAPGQLQWAHAFGGTTATDGARALGVAVDRAGNPIVVGSFNGTIDILTSSLTGGGPQNAFIAKLDPQGRLVWSKHIDSALSAVARSVAVDPNDNILVLGSFNGTVDFGGVIQTSIDPGDIFLVKYSPSGSLLWVKAFVGAGKGGNCVAVDANGEVFITGSILYRTSVDFGGISLPAMNANDIFLAKFGASGSLRWAKRFAGPGSARSVTVDRSGDAVIAGNFAQIGNFGGGPYASIGGQDIFIAKYAGLDGSFRWSKTCGDANDQYVYGVAPDPNTGEIWVTGKFSGSMDLGGGALGNTSSFPIIFLGKLGPNGSYVWSKAFQGANDDARAITVDASGNAFLTGTVGAEVDFGGGVALPLGNPDTFVAAFFPNGDCQWARRFTGASVDAGQGIATDSFGRILVAGWFQMAVDVGVSLSSSGTEAAFLGQFTK